MTIISIILLFGATLFLSYSNGANDNFKGVATLFGSRTTPYKAAIAWATATTFAGSLFSVFWANTLVKNFSGKGLVPDAIADASEFHIAVAAAAGLTVILATVLGFPISTTHGLTGALVGAGLMAIGTQVKFAALGKAFLLPLLLSPVLAIGLAWVFYQVVHQGRLALGIKKEPYLAVRQTVVPVGAAMQMSAETGEMIGMRTERPSDRAIEGTDAYQPRYGGEFWGIKSQALVDGMHFLSAGIVSFARGLNDTPKIASLILIGQAFSIQGAAIAVAMAMAIGGLLNARKVAETMSKKISTLEPGQGLVGNLITGMLVIAASRYGLPVSTTHVSVGSIFGVGLVSGSAHVNVFLQILLSWMLTLPIAAILSAVFYFVFHAVLAA
jgi:inorganic phosphate transporter, PiT family